MKDVIRHNGLVVALEGSQARVQIQQESACAGCHVRTLCQSSESKVKEVLVPATGVKAGDVVVLEGRLQQTRLAVLLAYVLPLALMLAILFVGVHLWGEVVALLLLVPALTVYYLVLYMLRDRIARRFTFHIVALHDKGLEENK